MMEITNSFQIRPDLEPYFEVYKDRDLICKLAGERGCMLNGRNATIKYNTNRGWYNFHRHLTQVHKFPKGSFKSVQYYPRIPIPGKPKSTVKSDLQKASTTKKHCIICLNCKENQSEHDSNQSLKEFKCGFPGSKKIVHLDKHMSYVFFLRYILEFPKENMAKYIKKCKGLRTPETWYFLCSNCEILVREAAEQHKQILSLQTEFLKIKAEIKAKMLKCSTYRENSVLTKIEKEIRQHIIGSVYSVAENEIKEERTEEPPVSGNDFLCGFNEGTVFIDEENICSGDKNSVSSFEMEKVDVQTPQKSSRVHKCSDRSSGKSYDFFNQSSPTCTDSITRDITVKVESDFTIHTESSFTAKNTDLDPTSADNRSEFLNTNEHMIHDSLVIINDADPLGDFEQTDSDFIPGDLGCSDDSDYNNFEKLKKSTNPRRTFGSQKKKTTSKLAKRKPGDLYMCTECPSTYKHLSSYREHREAHERSKAINNEFDCKKCGFPCCSANSRTIHESYRHKERGTSCTLCDYSAPNKKNLSVHMKEHRLNSQSERIGEKFHCKLCNRLFISYAVLCRHKRNVHHKEMGIEQLRCDTCSAVFSTKKHLNDHVQQTHRKQSKYYCEICGKGTLYASKLKRHMLSHMKDKKYICDICGADFGYEETLKLHLKRWHAEAVGGDGSFVSNGKLHSAQEAKKYHCKHCNAEFPSSSILHRHVKTHSEIYKNECDLCGNRYVTQQALKRHVLINHSSTQVPCEYCGKMFPHSQYAKSHYKFCKKFPGRRGGLVEGEDGPIESQEEWTQVEVMPILVESIEKQNVELKYSTEILEQAPL